MPDNLPINVKIQLHRVIIIIGSMEMMSIQDNEAETFGNICCEINKKLNKNI